MSKRDNKFLLKDIIISIDRINEYIGQMTFTEFSNDMKTMDAVLRNFEIIGEAASRFSDEFKITHPQLAYQDMKGMRNWLIHFYEGINYEIVWETYLKDLPPIRKEIIKILKNITQYKIESFLSRYLLELSYKGTNYDGWQVQKNTANTIQRAVNEKLSILLRDEIAVMASGRTDAGVHAKQNFVHFDISEPIPQDFLRRLNFMLPVDVAARNIFSVADNFNARFDAISRTYEYLICYDKNPLLTDFSSFYPYPELSAKKLNEAARYLKSQADFASFSKKRTQVKTTLCKIKRAHWELDAEQNLLRFNITADRFLRGMVRGIVATSIRYARGKLTMEQLHQLMESKKPHKTDFSAPPQGLTLKEVKYPAGTMKLLKL